MRTKEEIIQELKKNADSFLVSSNETQELIYLNDMKTMLWFLE